MRSRSGPVLGKEKHCKVLQPYEMLPRSFSFFKPSAPMGNSWTFIQNSNEKNKTKWQTVTETVVVPLLGKRWKNKEDWWYQQFCTHAHCLLSVLSECFSSLSIKHVLFSPSGCSHLREQEFPTKVEHHFCGRARRGEYRSPLWKVSWKLERRSVADWLIEMCQNTHIYSHTNKHRHTHTRLYFDRWSNV